METDNQNLQTNVNVKSDAHQIEDLQRQLKEKDATIEHLLEQMNDMRATFHALIDRNEVKQNADGSSKTQNENSGKESPENSLLMPTNVAAIPMFQDQSYFETYAHFNIHHDMLSVSEC